jgi:hypothetical protein
LYRYSKLPRLNTPSTYSALGVRRPTAFAAPPRARAAPGVMPFGGFGGVPVDALLLQFETLDEKYAADPEGAHRAMTMGVRKADSHLSKPPPTARSILQQIRTCDIHTSVRAPRSKVQKPHSD